MPTASRRAFLALIALLALSAAAALAQDPGARIAAGRVLDAATGEPLPSATVQLAGTYVGTITNRDGAFSLGVPASAEALVVRFLGYAPQSVAIPREGQALVVRLEPVPALLEEVVVTGEDPAEQIMRRVIEAKQRRRATLETTRADAYTRFTVRNDTGIVSVAESVTEAFWRRGEGTREVVKAQRVTNNLGFTEFLPAAIFVSDLYDDEIEIFGHTLRGVTHPKAISTYAFTLAGTRRLGESIVYDIDVKPRSRLASAFVGRVSVLGEADALLEVALSPGEAFLFPPPLEAVGVTFFQQFSNFGRGDDAPWLPLDFRQEATLKIGLGALLSVPQIRVDQVSRLTGYRINEPVPDSLYEQDRVAQVDSAAVKETGALAIEALAVPLTADEQSAYATIDSTDTLEDAFEPTGLLARFGAVSSGDGDGNDGGGAPSRLGLSPEVWYDRVAGAHLGLSAEPTFGPLTIRGQAGNATGPGSFLYEAGARLRLLGPRLYLTASYAEALDRRYDSDLNRGRLTNGLSMLLLGGSDAFDYYDNERFRARVGSAFRAGNMPVDVSVGFGIEEHASAERTTSYDVFGELLGDDPLRPNPPITPGRLASLVAEVTLGEAAPLLEIAWQRRLLLRAEVAPSGLLGSDFDFVHLRGVLDYRFPTFFRGRFLPNVLDVRVSAGYSPGALPPQRFSILESTGGLLPSVAGFRTGETPPYEGDRHLALYAEHHFRTVPFELIGWNYAVRKNWSVLVHGAAGRTWMHAESRRGLLFAPRVAESLAAELGVSLSGLFDVARIDATWRLDEPGFNIGIGMARLF